MEFLGLLWDQGIMRPMINALALLYHYLFLNYGLSIIAFTVAVRVLMIPLTIRQTRHGSGSDCHQAISLFTLATSAPGTAQCPRLRPR